MTDHKTPHDEKLAMNAEEIGLILAVLKTSTLLEDISTTHYIKVHKEKFERFKQELNTIKEGESLISSFQTSPTYCSADTGFLVKNTQFLTTYFLGYHDRIDRHALLSHLNGCFDCVTFFSAVLRSFHNSCRKIKKTGSNNRQKTL